MILAALACKNQGPPPIWLMRQAGRYLPEYRALREKHLLRDLFFTPALAAEITLMPIRRFGFDAAILFSDITVVAEALGARLDFNEGPIISPKITPDFQFQCDLEKLAPIFETIRLLKTQLSVPLIGFCGAPFTVATYLVGGIEEAMRWLHHDPHTFQSLLDSLAKTTQKYLKLQEKAGVDAIQIFDSWANLLTPQQFATFSLPYIHQLTQSTQLPSIFFMREAAPYAAQIPCAVSLDQTAEPAAIRKITSKTLQGNLDPDLLFAPQEMIRSKVQSLLESMRGDPAFIVNLGHGIKPQTPLSNVHCLLDTVRNFRL